MRKYVVQMEEIVVDEEFMETIDVWEEFGETHNLKEAKEIANQLVHDIKHYNCSYVNEISDKNNSIGVCISKYYEYRGRDCLVHKNGVVPGGIADVIEIATIKPKDWVY